MALDRREFLRRIAALSAGGAICACRGRPARQPRPADDDAEPAGAPVEAARTVPLFQITLSEWSLHRELFSGQLDPLDFARVSRRELGIDSIEYMSPFFLLRPRDRAYLEAMRARAEEVGVNGLLLQIRGAGELGHPDEVQCKAAVEQHQPWVEAAQQLGCRAISVQLALAGTREERIERAEAGLRPLAERAADRGLDLLVEGSEGACADPAFLTALVRAVDRSNCRAAPDLAVLAERISEPTARKAMLLELLPWVGAFRFTCREFNADGAAIGTELEAMLRVVTGAGYRGPIVINYDGESPNEKEGVRAARRLLAGLREKLTLEQIGSGGAPR